MNAKICFFIARHSHSGVPLAQMRLAKAFMRRGHQVYFVIGYVPEGVDTPNGDGINVVNLNQPRAFKLLLPIWRFIRAKRPDVIFSAEDHLNAIVSLAVILARSKAKLSLSSRIPPYDAYFKLKENYAKNFVLRILNRALWRRADALTCVSKDMARHYTQMFGDTGHKCAYNIIVDSDLMHKSKESVEHPWFADQKIPVVIGAGRLDPEKGFSDLVLALKVVNETRVARLVILGEGRLRLALEQQIRDEGLSDRAILMGFQANPYKYFAKGRVFVLSSYAEGLPSVLIEAMACGCNVVSTDCPTGPGEVLRSRNVGALVPVGSPQALASAIVEALNETRNEEAVAQALLPFTEDEVVREHQRILQL